MTRRYALILIVSLNTLLLLFSGCTNYEPVKADKCTEIVRHSSKILGKLAKPAATMLNECKNYSDEQRGCALQATIVADLVKCAKL